MMQDQTALKKGIEIPFMESQIPFLLPSKEA